MPKIILDITLSITGIVFLAPLFIIISVLIKLDSPGPVFFRQERIGKNGHTFRIYKFRSMTEAQEKNSLKITIGGDKRITKTGHLLRKYKIDELPQLFNVLSGNMSLVGPRPEVAEYVNHYSQRDKDIILSVRPGITDFASIRFRNESDILAHEENPQQAYIAKILPRKLRYCRFYVQKRSLLLDLQIIWMTLMAVARG